MGSIVRDQAQLGALMMDVVKFQAETFKSTLTLVLPYIPSLGDPGLDGEW